MKRLRAMSRLVCCVLGWYSFDHLMRSQEIDVEQKLTDAGAQCQENIWVSPNIYRTIATMKRTKKRDEETNEQITTTEAGKRLGVTPERIYQLIEEGKLPARRFGKAWVIDASDLPLVENRPKRGRPRKKKPDDEDE